MVSMEPAYHLPPIFSPVKGVRRNQLSNSFRGKEPGKTQLPPLKRVVTPAGIEKEKITTPRQEYDQQHVAKKKRKKKRNRCRSQDLPQGSKGHELASLSQSAYCSSPNLCRHRSVVEKIEELDPQTALGLSSHKNSDELQGESFSRIDEEPWYRNSAKIKARNAKARDLEHIGDEHAGIDRTISRSFSTKDNSSSLIQVLSSDQSHVRREEKEEFLEEAGWTDKSFHQKRRGTRIVQSKEHPYSVHPLEFHPHPPPQFRASTCKTQNHMMSHPNLPATDSPSNFSSLPRNGHSQVRQVCMHGTGSISSVTSEFQPHPPLHPRCFVNPAIRKCPSLSDYATIPLDNTQYHTRSPGQSLRNTSNYSKPQPAFPMDGYHGRCPEPRTLYKNIGHHSQYRNAGSSPVLSGFTRHSSRDYLVQGQLCLPASPVSKNGHFKTPTIFNSNRVYPLMDISQGQDVLQNTAFAGLSNEGPNFSEQQPYFPTGVRLPANCQWAIIDDAGSVTPLPQGSFPASSKKTPEESSDKSPDSQEGSFNSFPCPPASPNTRDPALYLPNVKEIVVEEPLESQLSNFSNLFLESPSANAPPKRKQRYLGVGKEEERQTEGSNTNTSYKGERMDTIPSSCKPLTLPVLDPGEDSPRVKRAASLSLTRMPNEEMESTSTEQSNASASAIGEKKQRNFKLPIGWCSNSKNWFKSPFKKEKKHPRKNPSMTPQNGHLPPLLTIDEFSSMNISDNKKSGQLPQITKRNSTDNRKKSVYTFGEFLKLCDEEEEDVDGIF